MTTEHTNAKMTRTVSSEAVRPRTNWFIILSKCEEEYEFNIGYKYSDGSVSFFSAAPRNATTKHPWGPPVECRFQTVKNKRGEIGKYFRFLNGAGDIQNLKSSLLDKMFCGENDFTRKCSSIFTNQNLKLLGNYLSLLPYVKGFSHHRGEFNMENGIRSDLSGVTENVLIENGGSLNEFIEFAKMAKESAIVVSHTKAEVFAQIKDKDGVAIKRKGQPDTMIVKRSKIEVTEDLQKIEIDDPNGVEKALINSYVGRADIKLSNLSISPKLAVKTNQFKVQGIAKAMKERFDPAKLQLTVCPVEESFNPANMADEKYFVVSGQHSFKALQKLQASGDLNSLVGLSGGKVSCYILNTKDVVVMNYSQIRSNDLGSKFVKKPEVQELLFYFESLKEHFASKSQAWEVIERYAKLLVIGASEMTALKKLCNWSTDSISSLLSVLIQYQTYETLDASRQGNQGRLMRGETLPISLRLFNKLGKVGELYFTTNIEKVVKKEISLKMLIEDYEKFVDYEKNVKILCDLAKCQNIDQLKDQYEGKFEQDAIEKFSGAEVEGNKRNLKGSLLEFYYESVISAENNEPALAPVSWCLNGDLQTFVKDSLDTFDVTVFNLKNGDPNGIVEIAEKILEKQVGHTSIVLFPSETVQSQAYGKLKDLKENGGFGAYQIFFDGDGNFSAEFCENLRFAIIFGKIKVFDPPLLSYNEDLAENLKKVVSKVCPPSGKVAYFSEGNLPMIAVHDNQNLLSKSVSYFGSQKMIDKLKTTFEKEKFVELERESIEISPVFVENNNDDSEDKSQSKTVEVTSEKSLVTEENTETSKSKDVEVNSDESPVTEETEEHFDDEDELDDDQEDFMESDQRSKQQNLLGKQGWLSEIEGIQEKVD